MVEVGRLRVIVEWCVFYNENIGIHKQLPFLAAVQKDNFSALSICAWCNFNKIFSCSVDNPDKIFSFGEAPKSRLSSQCSARSSVCWPAESAKLGSTAAVMQSSVPRNLKCKT